MIKYKKCFLKLRKYLCKNVRVAMYEEILRETQGTDVDIKNVDKIATDVLEVFKDKWNREKPVPIVAICRDIGFSIYKQDLPKEICGYIVIDGELKDKLKTDRIISVNTNESNKRNRFTIAHELGHYIFDFDPKKDYRFYNAFEHDNQENEVLSKEEQRANRFAAELLMPTEIFKEKHDRLRKSEKTYFDIVQELSDLFMVPPKAVEIRLNREMEISG